MKRFIAAAGLIFAMASASIAGSNANGIGYFALEVPADITITADGDLNDWAWFDPNFIYGPDDMTEILAGEMPTKADLDIAAYTAWTGTDRDNKIFGFVRVTDDTLCVIETLLDDGWRDDDLEVVADADFSGGPMEGEFDTRGVAGQQFTMHLATNGYLSDYGDGSWWLRWQVAPEMHWLDELVEATTTTVPAGQGNGATDVTVDYEFAMPLWDLALPDGQDASVLHINEVGQTIGFGYQLNEADNAEIRRTHQVATAGEEGASGNGDFLSEYTLLAIGEYDRQGDASTAVETQAWGKIKATFAR
jgi:hypothetical protein